MIHIRLILGVLRCAVCCVCVAKSD